MPSKKSAKKKSAKKKSAKKTATKKSAKKTATKKTAKKAAKKAKQAVTKTATNSGAPKASKPKKEMPAASSVTLHVGDAAPDFSLPGDDGQTHSLKNATGPVVVYFYPRDDTPGCTTEACDFRDNMQRISSKAVVYGVSKDSLKSHEKFKQKYNLNYTLLSDEDLATHRAYGAWGEKIMYGKPVVGVIRSTYLVKDGKIAAAWPRVKVAGHVDAVIHAIESL